MRGVLHCSLRGPASDGTCGVGLPASLVIVSENRLSRRIPKPPPTTSCFPPQFVYVPGDGEPKIKLVVSI